MPVVRLGLYSFPLSLAVFALWHGSQMASRLAMSSVPPLALGVM